MIKINESGDSFRKIRETNSYYVDKTEMLYKYLKNIKSAVLFARPRRFGKTLTMTMFRDFLDIRQNSAALFEGLDIMKYPGVVNDYMNQYPVIFLSLKEVYGKDFEAVFQNFQNVIATVCKDFAFLIQSENVHVDPDDSVLLESLKQQEGTLASTTASLDLLARMLRQYYDKPVFIIVDEYDVPMAKALGTSAYDQIRDMIEHMLSYVCKTNENVKAVILSGCLYTVKNSTYTGVNNIIPYTVLNPVYATSFGFTDGDVQQLLQDAGLSDRCDTVKEWYDGYLFGRDRMYCPWDVLRYVNSVLDGSYSDRMGPESYWLNTSDSTLDLIHGFLGKTAGAVGKFEQLLAGKAIDCVINDTLPYHRFYERGENIWSALLETGYLTKTEPEKMTLMPLKIPNRSIQVVFRQEVWDYFRDRVDNVFIDDLVSALWAGETEKAEQALDQILEATLSFYHEYHEYSYHLILDGFFTGYGYRVLSESESGYGRTDLQILDPARSRCLILELKHVRDETNIEKALEEAAGQIIREKYESRSSYEGYTEQLCYAMAFRGKKAKIIKKYS